MSLVYISCEIERGAFTDERAFEIALNQRTRTPSGECDGILVGSAHRMHLLDADKKPVSEDEPQYGGKICGFVRCEIIRKLKDGWVLIEVPSADLIHVPCDELVTV